MATIDNSGARISTQTDFSTYIDTLVAGYQTGIRVMGLEPSTEYYAKAIAVIGSTTYVSDNYVRFRTDKAVSNYLTFTANEPNVTISMSHYGTNQTTTKPVIYISMDKTRWTQWDYTPITLANTAQKVYMYGENPQGLSRSTLNYSAFSMTGSIAASGDCTTLLARNGSNAVPQYVFYRLFLNCMSLTTAPALPATTLATSCYENMFAGCASLTTAPALPATTLVSGCYASMFAVCTSLTTAPELPATTLANGCYFSMFSRCSSLTTAPELPATTLVQNCYQNMFSRCSSLTTAPELPATTLAERCYLAMFQNCTSLTTAPELPATTLVDGCYSDMFSGCTSLTTAPALPSTTLAINCYRYMFKGCTSLNEVTCLATDISAANSTTDWLANVAATGTFYKAASMNDWTTGGSGIPSGWTVEDADTTDYLTFTTNEPNVTISMSHYGTNQTTTKPVIYISRDKTNWTQWDFTPITLSLADQKIYMYGANPDGIGRSSGNYSTFQFSGSVAASGNCTTLLARNGSNAVPQYAFYRLFSSCTSLTTAPALPATTLAKSCYYDMFSYCTALTAAPALPATTLANFCYAEMFNRCTSLTTAPSILPATTLANFCYDHMFSNCTSLTTAPELPATMLRENCYYTMFYGCTSLNTVKCLATNISATDSTFYWLSNVAATGTFTKSANMSSWPSGASGIPSGWTVVNA